MRTLGRRRSTSAVVTAGLAAVTLALTAPGAQAAPEAAAAPTAVRTPTAPTYTVPRHANEPAGLYAARQRAVRYIQNGRPVTLGPDPRLSLTPGTSPADAAGWEAATHAAGVARAAQRAATRTTAAAAAKILVNDDEPAGGRGFNDSIATAQRVPGFGTRAGNSNAADISGDLAAAALPPLQRIKPNAEDDGALETAGLTGVTGVRKGFTTTGFLGDATVGPAEEDVDLYAFDLKKGQLLNVGFDVTKPDPVDAPFILAILDENGNFIKDSFFATPDWEQHPRLDFSVPTTGRYYAAVIGFTILNLDTGEVTHSSGDYTIFGSARAGDTDVYRFDLRAGDVLGVSVAGAAATASVYGPSGNEMETSTFDATSIFPVTTPLPGGGNAVVDAVAPRDGRYYLSVGGGDGTYTASAEVYRPGGTGKPAQTIFLDYDGARLNTGLWGGRGVTTLSPLSSFLRAWGLQPGDRAALGAAIKATVVENLRDDLRASGLSDSVAVKVVTSDESPDLWGQPGVTRVIVGGTIDESGIGTIGIAQSIDPGNFDREESALVLLDVMSGSPDEWGDASLNFYLRRSSDKLKFVGQAVGNVTSHEIGHMLGNWHTDNENTTASIMDAGGIFALLYGVGPDGIGGTADDIDTDFVIDRYDLFEGFKGRENTTAKSTWALSR